MKDKLFRDSVHGYISIPSNVCRDFVDTPIFQRLRYIEQTSMRVLYPSAHHDRFIHSLGVYHLGKMAFSQLRRNTDRRSSSDELRISPENWESYQWAFHFACLLHDCGHAPFSHTLEEQYAKAGSLDKELADLANCRTFAKDLEDSSPATHEKLSAILVLSEFSQKLSNPEHECSPLLVARMILGCLHHSHNRTELELTLEERFENCLIQLLNGRAIDVDKLDYILRDTWASGVDNVSIDVERLLGALILTTIDGDYPRLAFASQALSVLQSAVDARNFLYQWIYCHHKVVYDATLITRSVKALGRILAKKEVERAGKADEPKTLDQEELEGLAEEQIRSLFSTTSFRETKDVDGVPWFLPTDGDVACLLKRHSDTIPEVKEWLFRQHSMVPLWKTYAEYQDIFENKPEEDRKTLLSHGDKTLSKFCGSHDLPRDAFLCLKAPFKRVAIERNQLFVEVRGKPIPYSRIFEEKRELPHTYFLIFGPRDFLAPKDNRKQCLDFLIRQQ